MGARVRINNTTNFMEGQITAYTTTSLTVNVDYTSGSGTFASWTFNIAGQVGTSGYSGSGISGYSGTSGYSGYSGSGISGYSGYSGSGISGYSGYSGSGISGYSGYSGSGISGYSGYSGVAPSTITTTATTSNTTYYVVGATGTGAQTPYISNTNVVSYNASTGALSAVSMISSSDERLKTDWQDLPENFIELLAQVKHGVFTRISSNNKEPGVSAQSLLQALSEAVIEGEDGMLKVNYGGAALVSVIELANLVLKLQKEIEELKNKL